MLKYTELFYKLIGARIKNYRKKGVISQIGIKQTDIKIDTSTLSKIENGKFVANKNPHYLSSGQIIALTDVLGVSPTELVWGQKNDKELFLKLITIAILLNDKIEDGKGKDISPFYNIPFEEWVQKEWEYAPWKEREQILNSEESKEKFAFFINEKNWKLYNLLMPEFNKDYERISNMILQLLNHDYQYSKLFYSHLINNTKHTSVAENRMEMLLENFILHRGSYANFILDKNGVCYHKFICAFNKLWDKIKDTYISYFEECISGFDNAYLLQNGLKNIDDTFFHNIFTSPDFIKINESFSIFSEYVDSEAVLSSLNMRLEMIMAIQENKADMERNDNLLDTIYPIKALMDNLLEFEDFSKEMLY